MKKRNILRNYSFVVMGLLLMLTNSCKKDDNNNNQVKDVDGNVYNTVTIGTQVWMVENLKTTKYNDGTPLPNVRDETEWTGLSTPAYCWYNNDYKNYGAIYGALYNWYVVDPANTKKIAPKGWHVPTDSEWTILTDYLGGISIASDKLRETGTIHWTSPNISATNESAFTALPGGIRYYTVISTGTFESNGSGSGYWSSTLQHSYSAWARQITREADCYRGGNFNEFGFSIRCVKN